MKKCKIYYATVIESEGTWAGKDEKNVEPVTTLNRPPLGKEPEFCCEELKAAMEQSWGIDMRDDHLEISPHGSNNPIRINFCPLCGAKIVFIPNLKLKVCKYKQTYDAHYFEEV